MKFILFAALTFSSLTDSRAESLKADLDGDGTVETITAETNKPEGGEDAEFTLSVNGKKAAETTYDAFFDGALELKSVELDPDKAGTTLLHVSIFGANDLTINYFYRFEKGELLEVGEIYGQVEIPGNGAVLARQWMGFWNRLSKYTPQGDSNRLLEIRPEFYSVTTDGEPLKSKVKAVFPVYTRNDLKEVLANIKSSSTITILAAQLPVATDEEDDEDHTLYLILSETGFVGWATARDLVENCELPVAG